PTAAACGESRASSSLRGGSLGTAFRQHRQPPLLLRLQADDEEAIPVPQGPCPIIDELVRLPQERGRDGVMARHHFYLVARSLFWQIARLFPPNQPEADWAGLLVRRHARRSPLPATLLSSHAHTSYVWVWSGPAGRSSVPFRLVSSPKYVLVRIGYVNR